MSTPKIKTKFSTQKKENMVFIFGVDIGIGNNKSLQYFEQQSSSIINNNNITNICGGSKGDNEEKEENYKI
jgi:hypothetical protein